MSPETKLCVPPPPRPELETEMEVDLGRYWRMLVARWWLPVLGLVLGILAGFFVSTGRSSSYAARAIVYLGQPFAPGGATPIQNLPTKLGFAGQLVVSGSTISKVADKVGVRPSALRAGVSVKPITGVTRGRIETPAPLVEITVRLPSARRAIAAADALADIVQKAFSSYVDVKLATFQARFARTVRELEAVNERIVAAQQQQAQALSDRSLPAAEKFLVLANLNNVLQFNEQRRANLEGAQFTLRDQIALAQQVEQPRTLERATAQRASPPSRRTAAVVGALIGLILGGAATLLWEPVERRLKSRSAV